MGTLSLKFLDSNKISGYFEITKIAPIYASTKYLDNNME